MIQEVFDGFVNLDKVELDAFSFAMCDRIRYPNTYTLLAESEGKIIGFIHGYIQDRPYGKPREVAFCECFYIEPEYRGKKIGNNLLLEFTKWAEERNMTIEIMTNLDNKYWIRKGLKPYAVVYRR